MWLNFEERLNRTTYIFCIPARAALPSRIIKFHQSGRIVGSILDIKLTWRRLGTWIPYGAPEWQAEDNVASFLCSYALRKELYSSNPRYMHAIILPVSWPNDEVLLCVEDRVLRPASVKAGIRTHPRRRVMRKVCLAVSAQCAVSQVTRNFKILWNEGRVIIRPEGDISTYPWIGGLRSPGHDRQARLSRQRSG